MTSADSKVVVIGALFALFLAALEQTIVATALPAILGDVGDVELGSWVITAYLVSSVCATPVLGKLSDLYGRDVLLRACLALFVAGSLLCGFAPSMAMLIAARALQGIGGGGLITMAQTIVGDAVTPRERGRYAGYFSILWMTASVLGPVLGGVLAQHAGWRWIFWINLPLGAGAALLSERALRRLPRVRRPARVDLAGIALLTVASVALLAIVSRARTLAAIDVTTALLAIACAGATALFVWRERRAKEPIVPPHFLQHDVITPVLVSGFLVFGSYLALTVMMPLYFQLALGLSAARSGLLLVPMMLTACISALLAGRYTRSEGRYRRPPLLTLPLAIVASALLAIISPHGDVAWVTALAALVALGIGTIFPCTIVAAQAAAGPRDLGAVSGAVALSRSLGGAVFTGLLMALLLNAIVRALPEMSDVHSVEDLLRRSLGADARRAVLDAFGAILWVLTGALVLGLLAFVRLKDVLLPASVAERE